MVSLGAKNLNSNILEKYLEMAYFTTFGPKIEMLSVKIGPNGKKVDGIWSKTEIITKIYSDSYILIFSDSPLLFSQLCQTEEIERNKCLKSSSSSIGRLLQTLKWFTISCIKMATDLFMGSNFYKTFSFEIYFEKIKVFYRSGPGFKMGRGRISFE